MLKQFLLMKKKCNNCATLTFEYDFVLMFVC